MEVDKMSNDDTDSNAHPLLQENKKTIFQITSRRSLLEKQPVETISNSNQIDLQKTLVIYSGPTSMDRLKEKNGMYIDNMNYFLEHGISCCDDDARPASEGYAESVIVTYVFVVTQEVADYYTGPGGLIAKKTRECEQCERYRQGSEPFIRIIVREDRCYDMESMRVVLEEIDVQTHFDNLLFLNCGLVGPKFGPGTPTHIPSYKSNTHDIGSSQSLGSSNGRVEMVPYSHWTQLYTSRLTDSIRMVGHSINTHFYTFFPHVQSFLYAIKTDTVPLLLSSGSIYDCGLTQEELGEDAEKRFELINRYEVGMSTTLLKAGYKIATAFINRWEMGKPLVIDQNSTSGTELDDQISDIWYEDGVRNLTVTMSKTAPKWWRNEKRAVFRKEEDSFEYHKWDILPWDHFIFFKVSRLVPEDIQNIMNYNTLEETSIPVVPNDPRKSPSEFWQKKMGVFVEKKSGQMNQGVNNISSENDSKDGLVPSILGAFAGNVALIMIIVSSRYGKRMRVASRLRSKIRPYSHKHVG